MSSPFLLFPDPNGRVRAIELEGRRLTIGRRPSCEVSLGWDPQVSRLHAEIVQMGSDWILCDEGLSHNGTFVNGERLRGRRRLRGGDAISVGGQLISFCGAESRS